VSRIYKDFREAGGEIRRDLAEMGIRVHPKTYQDKNIEFDDGFGTLELQNYVYTVVDPVSFDPVGVTQPWADAEWTERRNGAMLGKGVNPGEAWLLREDVWKEFLSNEGLFAYTYSDRFSRNIQVRKVIDRLHIDKESRQLFIAVWDSEDTDKLGGISRVPCTLGYLLQCRKNQLNITYLQRSCDLVTHWANDAYLAVRLLRMIAYETQLENGTFTHWIGSLHMFKKDSEGIF